MCELNDFSKSISGKNDLCVGHLVLVGCLAMEDTRYHSKFGAFSHRSRSWGSAFWLAAREMALEIEDES